MSANFLFVLWKEEATMRESRKVLAFICLSFAFIIISFLVTQRIIPDWFIPIDLGMALAVLLLSVNLLLHRFNRTKK